MDTTDVTLPHQKYSFNSGEELKECIITPFEPCLFDSSGVYRLNAPNLKVQLSPLQPPHCLLSIHRDNPSQPGTISLSGSLKFEDRAPFRRTVIDSFMFFNELNILAWRLHELNDVVDHFVIVESTKTHAGLDKPLYFEANRDRFREFDDKIIHIIVDDNPEGRDPWLRERHQRSCIRRGLDQLDLTPHDLIIISDIDEVIFPEMVALISSSAMMGCLNVTSHWFNFGWHCYLGEWGMKINVITSSFLRQLDIGSNADLRHLPGTLYPEPVGWHASYFSDANGIVMKLGSYSHHRDWKDRWMKLRGKRHIESRMKSSNELFGLRNARKFDGPLPRYSHLASTKVEKL